MQRLDAFMLSLIGYGLAIAVHAPVATAQIAPEQALDEYEQAILNDLFDIPSAQDATPAAPAAPEVKPARFIQPAQGTFTSGYGPRWGRMHKGIDIAAASGTPIVASADGEVISAGWNSGGYGYLVEVRHGDIVTRYAHCSRILVSVGQSVGQGQAIALMGSTGNSTGPHLHFEVILPGKGHVNPVAFLSGQLTAYRP